MQTKYLQSQIFPLKLQMLFTCNDGNCEKSCRVVTVAEIALVLLSVIWNHLSQFTPRLRTISDQSYCHHRGIISGPNNSNCSVPVSIPKLGNTRFRDVRASSSHERKGLLSSPTSTLRALWLSFMSNRFIVPTKARVRLLPTHLLYAAMFVL